MIKKNSVNATKLEIIKVALKMFLENGYTKTSAKSICDELNISTGNLTFHFPTKEHLLSVLVELLCEFQWRMMEKETNEGKTSLMALCLEFTTIAAICEIDNLERDFYIAAYTHPMTLDIIRRNDAIKTKKVFSKYCKDWDELNYIEAETLVSGIEYATMKTTASSAPLDIRIAGSLRAIMLIYNVPEEIYKDKIKKVLEMDYRGLAKNILQNFKKYIECIDEEIIEKILIKKRREKYE